MPLWFPTMVCAGCSTRPGRPLWGRDACQDTASTEVERELKSTGRASACLWPAPKWWDGPAWRVSGVGYPRPPAFFCGGRCVFEFAPRTCPLGSTCYRSGDSASGGKKKSACVCLFVCVSVCLLVCLFGCLFVCVFVWLVGCLFVRWFVCWFVWLVLGLFGCSVVWLFVCLLVGLFICLDVCFCLCVGYALVSKLVCSFASRGCLCV